MQYVSKRILFLEILNQFTKGRTYENTSSFKVKNLWMGPKHCFCSLITIPWKETLDLEMRKDLLGHLVHLTASRELLPTVKKLTYWQHSLSSNLPGESLKARMTSLVYLCLLIISIVRGPIQSSLLDEERDRILENVSKLQWIKHTANSTLIV